MRSLPVLVTVLLVLSEISDTRGFFYSKSKAKSSSSSKGKKCTACQFGLAAGAGFLFGGRIQVKGGIGLGWGLSGWNMLRGQTPKTGKPPILVGGKCPAIADVILVLDSSGSMGKKNYKKMLQFVADLTDAFTIGTKNFRFAAIIFSDKPRILFGLKDKTNSASLKKAIRKAPYLSSTTHTDKAFGLVLTSDMFSVNAGGRPGASKIIIVLTDGRSQSTFRTVQAANKLKDSGVTIIAIGVSDASLTELRGMASSDQNVFTADNFDALNAINKKVGERTCQVPNEEEQQPTDKDVKGNANCPAIADIVLVIDASGSISGDDFAIQQKFTSYFVSNFILGPEYVQFGAITFSDNYKRLFNLGDYTSHSEISNALQSARQLKGKTNTGAALNYVADYMLSEEAGGRDFAKNVVVVITDGNSQNKAQTLAAGQRLGELRAFVIAIAVGDNTDQSELEGIASSKNDIFKVDDFSALASIQQKLAEHTCTATEQVEPQVIDTCATQKPCEQQCSNIPNGGYECSCNEGFQVSETDSTKCTAGNKCDAKPCDQICNGDAITYTCSCQAGYRINPNNSNACIDIDECEEDPCGSGGQCTNSVGSFRCVCSTGYEIDANTSRCVDTNECSQSPPVCDQSCVNNPGSYTCLCKEGYAFSKTDPSKCEEIKKCEANGDIIFVQDASSSIGMENFKLQQNFVKRVVQHFPIGPKKFRFAGLVFSNGVRKMYDLKDHTNVTSLIQAIDKTLYLKGQTYTGRSLDYIIDNKMFSLDNGGREESPDIAVVITDGESTDRNGTEEAVYRTKLTDTILLCVGIGDKINRDELNMIASSPEYVIIADSFTDLAFIEDRVAERTCLAGQSKR